MKKSTSNSLWIVANIAFQNKDYETAIALYEEIYNKAPFELKKHIEFNLSLALKKSGKRSFVPLSKLERPENLERYFFDLIEEGKFFDQTWYLTEYKDKFNINSNPLTHYLDNSTSLSLNPSPNFNTSFYLKSNPDVAKSELHPFLHYVCQGHKEGRVARPPLSNAELDKYTTDLPYYVQRLPVSNNVIEKAVRAIAFYLPQFHPIPENNAWWGEGFTEWSNVKPAKPYFKGHYQPHVPDEFLGYYDLRDTGVMYKQIELAKQYGIEGFCFYTYWFTGHRLLEIPIDNYLTDKSLDLPFCICWANENWSRRWDGLDQDLLMVQNYSAEDDLAFIAHMSKYLRDSRYIKVEGKPLLIVYRPNLFPSMRETAQRWRSWCRENGLGEIYIAYVQSFEKSNPAEYGLDAAIEFPPNNSSPPDISDNIGSFNMDFSGKVYDWRVFLKRAEEYSAPDYTVFRGLCPSWDNTARKKERGTIFSNSCPKLFEKWLTNVFTETQQSAKHLDHRMVFINAWNEWAEGAHLEPDQRYGYAWLQAVRDAHHAAQKKRSRIVLVSHDAHPHGAQILCLHLARCYKEQFHFEVDLIVLGDGSLVPKYQQYARVHSLKSCQIGKSDVDSLLSSLRIKGAKVAIVNTTVSGLLTPHLKEHGFSVVSLVHEMPSVLSSYKLQKHANHIANYADKVVFPAQQVKEGFEAFIGRPLSQASIRPQGLYMHSLLRKGADKEVVRAEVRQQLGLSTNAKIVMSSGYADHRKGFDLFVQSCIRVMGKRSDTFALWVGHLDQNFVDQSMKMAETAGLRDKFIFTGLVDHPQAYFIAADVFSLTSREDPFPSVVMEALDALTPVVAFSGCGGFEDLLKRNCGELVLAGDHAALAEAVISLLDNPQHARALAETGRNIVQREFNFHHYIFDLQEFSGHPIPRVSVVVPNYNYERYIRQRLESIIKQTYPIFELIVLDDCSTDNSVRVISDYLKECDIPHRFAMNEMNSGSVFSQWYKGIEIANGELIWIAEADDLSEVEFLDNLVSFFNDPSVVFAFSQSKQIDENRRLLSNDYIYYTNDVGDFWREDYVIDGAVEIERALCIKNTIPNVSGVIFRRSKLLNVFQSSKGDILSLKVAGDWLLYLLLANSGKVAYKAISLNVHRRHTASVTNKNSHLNEVIYLQKKASELTKIPEEQVNKMNAYIQYLKDKFYL